MITQRLADATNRIGEVFARIFNASEKICVDGECLTKSDIRALKAAAGLLQTVVSPSDSSSSSAPAESAAPEPIPEKQQGDALLDTEAAEEILADEESPLAEEPSSETPSQDAEGGAASAAPQESPSEPVVESAPASENPSPVETPADGNE